MKNALFLMIFVVFGLARQDYAEMIDLNSTRMKKIFESVKIECENGNFNKCNTLAKFWAVLMSISLAAEKGESIDFLGFSLDQTPKIITYFKRFFGNTLTTILSALFGFFDKVYTIKGLDEAARDGEYCIYNDNKIYAGDAYFQFEVEYDLGTEHVVYDIYLRNGVPIILESYGPIRLDWPSDGYLPVGHVKGWIKEWKEDGYVLSQYHLDRNSTFNEDYGITE